MRRMGGMDAAFVYGETPTWHMHVSALMTIDPSTSPEPWSFERLRALTLERLPQVPQFRWKFIEVPFGLDRPLWVEDEEFDPEFHIRRIGVPSPGGPDELGNLVGQLTSYKLDRRKPLWEMWVIDGLADGKIAILVKMHHAIIDGASGAGLAEVLLDLDVVPRPPSDETVGKIDGPGGANPLELFGQGLLNAFIRTPYRMMRMSWQLANQGLVWSGFLRRKNAPTQVFSAPRTSLNGSVSAHRRFGAARVDLSRVKALRKAYDVKVNDVVLALCAGALRRYLEKADALPEHALIAQCPVSLRTDEDRDAIGNRVGSLFCSLATDISDPVLRLQAIHASTQSAKEMREALSVHSIMGLTDTTPPGLISLASRMYSASGIGRRTPPPVNVVISNVPGPPFPLYLAGGRLESLYPMGPLLFEMGLNITVMSYCDSIDFGLMCCPELIPDPETIAEGIELALAELEEAAGILT